MVITYLGGQHAGLIGFLTVLSLGHKVNAAVAYSDELKKTLQARGVKVFGSIKEEEFKECARQADVILSVHGREIVPEALIQLPRLGALNVHPYLYCYKGAGPIQRALQEQNHRASVGMHYMTPKVDSGEVLVEEFMQLAYMTSIEAVYGQLYPLYHEVIVKGCQALSKKEKAHTHG
jgi:methionyl-tRNA formyltransferase